MEALKQLRYRAAATGTGTLVVTIEQLNAIHADAQVTIATLQASLDAERAEIAKVRATCDMLGKERNEADEAKYHTELKLQQHTSELEAANTLLYKKNCALVRAETSINDLQAELERVRGLVKTYADAKIDFDDKRLQEDLHAWRERYTRLVGAETILIVLTATSQPVPPYKEWCRHPEKCAGLASCPQDPTCAD